VEGDLTKRLKDFFRTPYRLLRIMPWVIGALVRPRMIRTLSKTQPKGSGPLTLLYFSSRYLRDGRRRILVGDLRLTIEWQGKPCDYVEQMYLEANPDVASMVKSGQYRAGLDHYVATGMQEVLEGKRKLYGEGAKPALISRTPGAAPVLGNTLCFFAHYDRQSLVDPYVLVYLHALRDLGCDIVFSSGTLAESEIAKVVPLCREVLVRNPLGYDFTSWYVAIKHTSVGTPGYGAVLLVNDSTYFPFRPTSQLLETMAAKGYDFWGLCDSYQSHEGPRYHIQSFFMGLSPRAVEAGLLPKYLERYESYGSQSRAGYIEAYEYGISEMAKELGLSMGVYCSLQEAYEASTPRGRHKLPIERTNPSIHLWREIISVCSCPALKIALIRDNPEGYFDWADLERLATSYDLELIRSHLARTLGKLPAWIPSRP